jgi:hypothetical protein
VVAGTSTDYGISISHYNGHSKFVRLMVSGLPAGATASISSRFSAQPTLHINTSASTPPGIYLITVTGRHRSKVHSARTSFTVGLAPEPFTGSVWQIPSQVEAEDYDTGGEGIGYHDTSAANQGGAAYRDDAVDIESCSDTGGGYNLGYTSPGEWLRYTAEVASDGLYKAEARVAVSGGGRNFPHRGRRAGRHRHHVPPGHQRMAELDDDHLAGLPPDGGTARGPPLPRQRRRSVGR